MLSGGKWRALPSMHEARADFNPCEFEGRVYLCGYSSDAIEAFDPGACVFHLLQVRLPESNAWLLVVESGQLLVLTDHYATRWEVDRHHSLRQVKQTQHSGLGQICNAPPVLDSVNGLLYVAVVGMCFSISLEDNSKRRVTFD